MMSAHLSPTALRQLMATLALVAACIGGLVPSGWMPQAESGGRFSLVVCSGDGLREITLDAHGNPVEAQTPDTAALESPCAFAGLNAAATLPAPSFADAPGLAPQRHVPAYPAATIALPANPASPPGQRGPPDGRLTDIQTA